MIGVVGRVIEGILIEQGSQLNDESSLTVLAETAAVINSRPLAVQNLDDPLSQEPLTPNHLLTMKSKVFTHPVQSSNRHDLYALRQWRRAQYLIDLFWTRWRKEMSHTLQSRVKWNIIRENLKVDDIVLIVDEQCHRSHWKLARIIEVYLSADGLVRSVKLIRAYRSILTRPVQN